MLNLSLLSDFFLLSLLEKVWDDTSTRCPLKDQWEGFLGAEVAMEVDDSCLISLMSSFILVTSLTCLEMT